MLVVDDSFETRELYSLYLRHQGFQVLTAGDGQGAIEIASSLVPDIVVLDLSMPRVNGITVTQVLKREPGTQKIPIIMLTGYPSLAIEQGALEAGVAVFLTKPCLPEELDEHVRRLLARR